MDPRASMTNICHATRLGNTSPPPSRPQPFPMSTVALSTASPLAASPTVILTSSRWSFTQGFLVGQATFLVLCGLFIKYVVFEDAERSRQRSAERVKVGTLSSLNRFVVLIRCVRLQKAVLSTTNVPPPSSSELLEKTGYEMATHASESADWINVLFAEVNHLQRTDLNAPYWSNAFLDRSVGASRVPGRPARIRWRGGREETGGSVVESQGCDIELARESCLRGSRYIYTSS